MLSLESVKVYGIQLLKSLWAGMYKNRAKYKTRNGEKYSYGNGMSQMEQNLCIMKKIAKNLRKDTISFT